MLRLVSLTILIAALGCGGGSGNDTHSEGEASPGDSHVDQARHWDYGKENGPAHWAELSPDFVLCAEGKQQSPIDIVDATRLETMSLETEYRPGSLQIVHQEHVVDLVNNGHTVQVNYDAGSTLTHGEDVFELKQFHFHAPSEHTVEGKHFPIEMHLVHQSESGELAVLGVLVEEGPEHAGFVGVFRNVPVKKGETLHFEHVSVDIDALLPGSDATYRYRGSLTTPPCSEGVRWFVFTEPIQASSRQIAEMSGLIAPNNRPVQPLNDREIGLVR